MCRTGKCPIENFTIFLVEKWGQPSVFYAHTETKKYEKTKGRKDYGKSYKGETATVV